MKNELGDIMNSNLSNEEKSRRIGELSRNHNTLTNEDLFKRLDNELNEPYKNILKTPKTEADISEVMEKNGIFNALIKEIAQKYNITSDEVMQYIRHLNSIQAETPIEPAEPVETPIEPKDYEVLFERLDNDPYISDYDRNSLLSAYTEQEIDLTGLFDNILEKYGITNEELLEYANYLRKELGIDSSQQQNAPVESNINEKELFKKIDSELPYEDLYMFSSGNAIDYFSNLKKHYDMTDEELKEYIEYKRKELGIDSPQQQNAPVTSNINENEYIEQLKKEYHLSDEELYDRLKRGMFSKAMKEEEAQKLLDYLETKPNNIEKYIEQLKKEYHLSDEELYDRLKRGMFSKVMNEEKAQKLLDHLETKPNNIEKYIEQLKKEYQLSDDELYDRLKRGMFSKAMKEEKAQKLLDYLETKPNNIEKYIEQLKKEYHLSDEELYDRLKRGMFSKVMNEEKAQKLLDHLKNKPNNIDDEINKIEKERQTLAKRFKPKKQKFEELENDESELEQDFEKENEEEENEIISTRDGRYLSKKDRFVKWVKDLPLGVKIGACVAGAVALGAAIYHFTQGDAQPLSDIIQNAADAVRGTAQSVTPPEPVGLSGLGDLNIPVYESFSNAAGMVNPLHANEWFQWDNIQNMLLSDGRIIDCSNMPHEDIIQMCKDGIAKGIGFGMDENHNMSGFTNAQELLQHLQSSVGGRTL